jgi:hypothetical protein
MPRAQKYGFYDLAVIEAEKTMRSVTEATNMNKAEKG